MPEDENESKDSEETVDPRTKKITKALNHFNLFLKDGASQDHMNFHKVSAESKEYARNLANIRGTVADPAFMENEVHKLVDGNSLVHTKVIKGKELQDLGMNLFYNVGKGAQVEPRCVVVEY
mmetsp:Transcript_12482/g.8699  ORF Transcript_12482/g.8699 Transcript_12482/m.8699 type:complete len:122 (+) Transcript_12482:464-829(+)